MRVFSTLSLIAGELTKVRVWHDNKFLKASWYLERINIEDQTTKKIYEFPCDRWLGKDKEDGSLLREIPCSNRDETTDSPVAGTLRSLVFRKAFDWIRLSCVLRDSSYLSAANNVE